MIKVTDEQFEDIINQALDSLPPKYVKRLKNVAILSAETPSAQQRKQLNISDNQLLFGLYQGIPLTKRGSNYTLVLPDTITIFKQPHEQVASSLADLQEAVRKTLWHEIAHYFGLDHQQIDKLSNHH